MSRTCVLVLMKGLGVGGAERPIADAAPSSEQDRFSYRVAFALAHRDAFLPDLERRERFGIEPIVRALETSDEQVPDA